MMEFKIKKGQTDWRPREWPQIFRKFSSVTIRCVPGESMQFDYGGDQDWKDWKKIGGLSFATLWSFWNLFRHNQDAIHLGWRWNPELKVHEFCTYFNEDGRHTAYERPDQLLRVKSGREVTFIIERHKAEGYGCFLMNSSERLGDVNPIIINLAFTPKLFATSGLWYGGKNNSPGPYGGQAPKDMTIQKEIMKR